MKQQDAPASAEKASPAPTRKAYQKPQLQVYGDLSEITRSVGGTKMSDGAAHPNKHFTS